MSYPPIEDDPRLTAFALGEIDEDAERAEVEARLEDDPEARAFVEDVRRLARALTEELQREPMPVLEEGQRVAIERELAVARPKTGPSFFLRNARQFALAAVALIAIGLGLLMNRPALQRGNDFTQLAASHRDTAKMPPAAPAPLPNRTLDLYDFDAARSDPGASAIRPRGDALSSNSHDAPASAGEGRGVTNLAFKREAPADGRIYARVETAPAPAAPEVVPAAPTPTPEPKVLSAGLEAQTNYGTRTARQPALRGANPTGGMGGGGGGLGLDSLGKRGNAAGPGGPPVTGKPAAGGRFLELGGKDRGALINKLDDAKPTTPAAVPETAAKGGDSLDVKLGEVGELAQDLAKERKRVEDEQLLREQLRLKQVDELNREAFAPIQENPFVKVTEAPLSTFGIDVDTASYANVRRFLLGEGRMPPPDAVRIEELVNYFSYAYPTPVDDKPFAVNVEFARCPWQADHRLLRVGLKGREVPIDKRPPSNLVFLIDVSGSMNDSNKLPWVKSALAMLVDKLTENDRVTIVVYAAAKGVALPPTQGDKKDVILATLDRLHAGGSTNGGEGLKLAYDIAQAQFINGGTNRIILCTDGDFNTGDVTDLAGVTRLVEEKRATKVKLTVLGFGQGNLQDDKLEALANKGDGQYAYIDTLKEAQRVLVEQMSGTLLTIAKDVKLQLDFNPRFVGAYRLLGYENRMLRAQDFRDDTKDAGDIGAGHTVTALYELMPPGKDEQVPAAGDSKFVEKSKLKEDESALTQTLVVNLRYKEPDGDVSTGFDFAVRDDGKDYAAASADFKFAAAVAEFGLLLRESKFKGTATYEATLELAEASKGADPKGERKEFLDLVRIARDLSRR